MAFAKTLYVLVYSLTGNGEPRFRKGLSEDDFEGSYREANMK